jgi:hypothetical protein
MGSWTETVTLKPGERRTLRGKVLQDVKVTISVTGGDAVRIGTKTHKNGATVTLRQGSHRVEILKGGEVVETQNLQLPRIASCTLRDRPDFECAP